MAVLHSLEEKFYGADSPLPAKARVLLYMRHRFLRDWLEDQKDFKPIGKADIIQATGIEIREAKRILKAFIEDEILLYIQEKKGKEWKKNSYRLHPSFVGNDYVYNGIKKPLRLIPGGKKSYPQQSKSYPQEECQRGVDNPQASDNLPPTVGDKMADSEHENSAKPFLINPSLKPEKVVKSFTCKEWNREPTEWDLEKEKTRQLQMLAEINR